MDLRKALRTQYHAALEMLRQTVERCPDEVWTAAGSSSQYWQIAYHTLFFTHLYLQPDEDSFRPWGHHRGRYEHLGPVSGSLDPYSKASIMEYWDVCDQMVDGAVDALDLDAPASGFHWYRMPKLDHQFVNVRHVQHHVGQLHKLLQLSGGEIDWIGAKAAPAGQ